MLRQRRHTRMLFTLLVTALLAACAPTEQTLETNEEATPDAEADVHDIAQAEGKPNLVVRDVSGELTAEGAVRFRATIANTGAVVTPAGVIHGVSFWVNGKAVSWSDDHTAALQPGASVTVTANGGPIGRSTWTPTASVFSVEAWVDDVRRMEEADENDNKLSRTLSTEGGEQVEMLPNLTVSDIGASWEQTGLVFRATIANRGGAPSPANVIHGVSFWVDGAQTSWSDTHMASLAPGETVTVVANGGPAGSHTWAPEAETFSVEAFVDDVARMSESNEEDNTLSRTVTVNLSGSGEPIFPQMPNLTITNLSAERATGDGIVFRATLENTGNAPTPAGVIHGVSFRVNGAVASWSDHHTASLAPGERVTVVANGGPQGTHTWTATVGTFTLQAWVDDLGRMQEGDEHDNKLNRTLMFDIAATAAPTCTDGLRNGGEQKVDCGGDCGPCEWPFDTVPRETLRNSKKKVFAHWHYYPIATSNADPRTDYYERHWVNPLGESGKHEGYGGFMRERPLPRLPRPESDWLLRDMEQDVRLAASIGIDGFFLNLWTDSDSNNGGVWTRATTLVDAATKVGNFDIIPNYDMSILGSQSDAEAQNTILRTLGKLKGKSALYRMPDGRWVVGMFLAERRSAAFYDSLKKRAASELQMKLYLVQVFLGTGTKHFSTYASVSDAYAGWGTAIPTSAGKAKAVADLASSQNLPWIHPVSNQDFRPYNYKFWEAKNTQTLRSHWETVIADGMDWVQIVTWNDHHEHHAIRPSTGKQWSAYDLTAYYIQWFKTGTRPTIKRDVLLYNHRVHRSTAAFDTSRQLKAFACVTGCPAVDEIELVAFLKEPGTIEITAGGATVRRDAPAGMSVLKAPLAVGRPTFRLLRGGATAISFRSDFDVRSTTTYQDLLYRGGSSARSALSSSGTCASVCEAGDAAACELCPAEPMWLKR